MDEQEIKQLKLRLDELEKMMKSMMGQGMSYYINIEHAEIQGPIVDKLDYNFDKLDVNEVSGALNLGNNFGVRVGKVSKSDDEGGSSSKENGGFVKRSTSQKKDKEGEKKSSPNQSVPQNGQEKAPYKDQKSQNPLFSNGETRFFEKGSDSPNNGAGSGRQDTGHSQAEAKKLGHSKPPLSSEGSDAQIIYVFGEKNTLKPKYVNRNPDKQETLQPIQSVSPSSDKENYILEKIQTRSCHDSVNLTTENPRKERGAPPYLNVQNFEELAKRDKEYDISATKKGFSFKKNDLS